MNLGSYLRQARARNGMTLRDVEKVAKDDKAIGAELSTGYLSLLERNQVQQPSPRILHALAQVYHESYVHLMRLAGYLSDDMPAASSSYAFRGADQLSDEQKRLIQKNIDFLLDQSRRERQMDVGD